MTMVSERRKVAAILVADIVGYSRLTGADEERTLARLRSLRSDLIDPTIAVHNGRLVKRTGDGAVVEFRSVVEAVRAAIDVQGGLAERNAGVPDDRRIEVRVGIHLGDVVEEADGDLMGDGVNVAARLEAICEPGGICLSEDAYRQVRDKLHEPFADLGEQSLKNIARPMRVYAVRQAPPEKSLPPKQAETPGPPRLSLVVLPFANLSGDPGQDYFADGVTETLTTDLSRIPGAFVIGRSTAFTYKGKAADLRQIGRELNVRYVLEGSVQRGGDRLRVNVQLIEAETGSHLWAERFDKPMADLFIMQDEIVSRLANELRAEMVAAEARRAERPLNPDAIDLHFQGLALINSGPTPETVEKARSLYERALELDPGYVNALIDLAALDAFVILFYMTDDPAPFRARAEARLMQALAAEPNNPFARWVMGFLLCAHRPGLPRHRGIRARSGPRSEPRGSPRQHGPGQDMDGPGGGSRGACRRGHAPEPARPVCSQLVGVHRHGESVSRRIRTGLVVAAAFDRRRPRIARAILLSGGLSRKAGATRRGAAGGQGGSRGRPEIHHRPISRRRAKRQRGVPRPARTGYRGDASRRRAGR